MILFRLKSCRLICMNTRGRTACEPSVLTLARSIRTTSLTRFFALHSMALQFSCQNIFDLAKYVIVMVLSRPSQFKYAALVSFISVVLACFTYLIYVRRTRGHLVHFDDWSERLLKRKKKT